VFDVLDRDLERLWSHMRRRTHRLLERQHYYVRFPCESCQSGGTLWFHVRHREFV
jgi:hypothetical protein